MPGQTPTQAKGIRGYVARYFRLRDAENETFQSEIVGGLTMYAVCVYILQLGRQLQAGFTPPQFMPNKTTEAGFTVEQYSALPTSISLVAGISSILMGIIGNVPFVVAPGVTTAVAFHDLSAIVGPQGASAASMVVGFLLIFFAASSRTARMIMTLPEDFRLGVAGGIGGLLALVSLRDMMLVPQGAPAFITTFQYQTVLSVLGVIIIGVIQSMSKRHASLAFITEVTVITILSVCVRAGMNQPILIAGEEGIQSIASLTHGPSFENWTQENSFVIFKFVLQVWINKMCDLLSTVTAVILIAVMSKLGYSKDTFSEVLSESEKCVRIYAVDAFCNVVLAPMLGTATVTPFIESAAGVVVGARTGLSSVVAGTCFLISCLFASPIAVIIPGEATGPAVLVACFAVIQSLEHIDYQRASRSIPSLLAFFLIPFTMSIGIGVSFAYLILFATWACTPNWVLFRPQFIVAASFCTLLLVVTTGLVSTNQDLGIAVGVLFCFALVAGMVMFRYREYFEGKWGRSTFDKSNKTGGIGKGGDSGQGSHQSQKGKSTPGGVAGGLFTRFSTRNQAIVSTTASSTAGNGGGVSPRPGKAGGGSSGGGHGDSEHGEKVAAVVDVPVSMGDGV